MIKFRAWDKIRKEMVFLRMIELLPDNPRRPVVSVAGDGRGIEPAFDFEIMQFTGLHDKNGKEIYDGDILEEEKGYYFTVIPDKPDTGYRLQHSNKAFQYPDPGWNRGKKMSIIGNVFENPELLTN